MHNFKKLTVMPKAHELTLAVYRLTRSFPPEELYGLTTQMRRSAASIGSNLAEGSGRPSDADFSRFIFIALGSAKELEYELRLARDLGLLSVPVFDSLDGATGEVQRMLIGLIRKLKARDA